MSTTPTTQPSSASYPKHISRTLELEVEVSTLEEENYFSSMNLDDDLIGDLARGFFPEIGLTLISVNKIKLSKL